MITESKIELLESLVKQADKFEKKAPTWNKLKMGFSAFVSCTLFALSLLIELMLFDIDKLQTLIGLSICGFFIMGITGSLICWYITRIELHSKKDTYDSPIGEIIRILQKLKQQL
jgi:hypothetical protein